MAWLTAPPHPLGQQGGQPHDGQRQQEPGQQQPLHHARRPGQGAAGQHGPQVPRRPTEEQVKDIHQGHGLSGGGERGGQRGVGAEIGCPHDDGVHRQPQQIHPAQVLEGVDEAPAEDHAVQLEGIVEDAADGQAPPLDGVPQHDHHHEGHGQHHGESQIHPGRQQRRSAPLPSQGEGREAQRHEPDIQEAVHDDGGQGKAHAGFHPAAHKDRPEDIPQVEGQQRIDHIAAGHAPQHGAALGPLINAHELLPPQQAEGMSGQHQGDGQQEERQHHDTIPLSCLFFWRRSTA